MPKKKLVPTHDFSECMIEQAQKNGIFIAQATFVEVHGEGIVTSYKMNKQYFPNPQKADAFFTKMQEMFITELEKEGIITTKKVTLQ